MECRIQSSPFQFLAIIYCPSAIYIFAGVYIYMWLYNSLTREAICASTFLYCKFLVIGLSRLCLTNPNKQEIKKLRTLVTIQDVKYVSTVNAQTR